MIMKSAQRTIHRVCSTSTHYSRLQPTGKGAIPQETTCEGKTCNMQIIQQQLLVEAHSVLVLFAQALVCAGTRDSSQQIDHSL